MYKSQVGRISPMKGKKHNIQSLEKMSKTWFKKDVPTPKYIIEKRAKKITGIKRPEWLRIKLKEVLINNWKAGKMVSVFPKGEKHHWWKGGASSFCELLENSKEYKYWRKTIFLRDNRVCKKCGDNKNINAHHIKALAELYQEFLATYSQFSPIEDKETLVRLALTYAPFWDINNGVTLCEDCHKRTDNFGAKQRWNKNGIYK